MWGVYSSQIQKGKQKQNEAMQPGGKGVGGYRPTINWREISVRQRNVSDRQIIACILVAGVVVIVIGVLVAVLGFFVISSQCPFEWTYKDDLCFYFSSSNASYADARDYCTGFGSTFLAILDRNTNDFISRKVSGNTWIGLKCNKKDGSWKWASNDKLDYTSWRNKPFACPAGKGCAKVGLSGDWETADCADQLYFVCQFRPGYNPVVLIGPVVALCGVIILILSIEVCYRRRDFVARNPEVMDKDDDEHKVDEGIINYGYGHFDGTKSPATVKQGLPKNISSSPWPSKNKTGPEVIVEPSSAPGTPKLAVPQPEEHTPSQEQLELLLSPKNL